MQMVRIRKDIIALFKEEGLSITIETNLIETGFLDVTFNLATKKYFLFRKASNTPLYINVFSNHLPTIIKQLLKMVNKRISDLSCNKGEFDKVRSVYESALKQILLKTLGEIETGKLYRSTYNIAKM